MAIGVADIFLLAFGSFSCPPTPYSFPFRRSPDYLSSLPSPTYSFCFRNLPLFWNVRFEFFVRSHLSRGKVKDILATSVTSKYIITGMIC